MILFSVHQRLGIAPNVELQVVKVHSSPNCFPSLSSPDFTVGFERTGRTKCIATDAESAQSILLHLLYSVDREIDRLDALIAEIERLVAQGDDGSSAPNLF